MQNASFAQIELGTILCKHCHEVLGTLDTEKVTMYYSECKEKECIEARVRNDKQVTQR